MQPLPPTEEARAQALALALAPAGPHAQTYLNRAARVSGWTPTLRRANYLRCRWQRRQGEYRGRQQSGGCV